MFEVSIFRTEGRGEQIFAGKPYDPDKIWLATWQDHCVECSYPLCYGTCAMYERRYDGRCVRVRDGLVRNFAYSGFMPYGLDCRFRKWAKLETFFHPIPLEPDVYRSMVAKDERRERAIGFLVRKSGGFHSFLGLRNRYRKSMEARIASMNTSAQRPDAFIIQCHLPEADSARLLVQFDNAEGTVYYSRIYTLSRGANDIEVPLEGVGGLQPGCRTRIFVTPLGDDETRIVFTWLNLISYPHRNDIPAVPAAKVKCVAWDLDNTLWHGTLVEDGPDALEIDDNCVATIKELDRRGILNTIVSKNDEAPAMEVLRSAGLSEYFLCPAINWGQKSLNIKSIAGYLNIGIDTFAFVDDNIRERSEVSAALPCVRTYAETEAGSLTGLPEFDVAVTEESPRRRLSYMEEVKRKEFKAGFSSDYDGFLRELGMTLERRPVSKNNFDRSLELLARTNQLNLRTVRYDAEGFRSLLASPDIMCFAFSCSDRFGDYGQVGVMSVKISGSCATILDFVISCRIAGKKVEQAMVTSLRKLLEEKGIHLLEAVLTRTERNRPIENVFDSLPFHKEEKDGKTVLYSMDDISLLVDAGIVKLLEINE